MIKNPRGFLGPPLTLAKNKKGIWLAEKMIAWVPENT